jgi:hypothetical protein
VTERSGVSRAVLVTGFFVVLLAVLATLLLIGVVEL